MTGHNSTRRADRIDLDGLVITNLLLFHPTFILGSSPHRTDRTGDSYLPFALLLAQWKMRTQSRCRHFRREKSLVFREWCSPPQVHRFSARKSQANFKTSRLGGEIISWCMILFALFSCPNNPPHPLTLLHCPPMQHLTQSPHSACGREPSMHLSSSIANLTLSSCPLKMRLQSRSRSPGNVRCASQKQKPSHRIPSRFQGLSGSLPYAAEESLLQTALQNWRRISSTPPQPAFCGPNPAIYTPRWRRWPCAGHPLSPEDCCIRLAGSLLAYHEAGRRLRGWRKGLQDIMLIILNLLNTRR